jgi:hypothetical protein
MRYYLLILLFITTIISATGQSDYVGIQFWQMNDSGGITWDLSSETNLPHKDNIEMSGRQVAGIIHYEVDENKILKVRRHLIYPQLRVFLKSNDSRWLKYRAYLKKDYEDVVLPIISKGETTYVPGPVSNIHINGLLEVQHEPVLGISLSRKFYPSMDDRQFIEQWTLTNNTDTTFKLNIGESVFTQQQKGIKGEYLTKVTTDIKGPIELKANGAFDFSIVFTAEITGNKTSFSSWHDAYKSRREFISQMRDNLILETPDEVLNTLFYFSKIRAAGSIFDSKMGLVHSPGGGRYYAGVWANDQAEYSGPFFPFLGYEKGNIAALNAYKVFYKNIPEDGSNTFSSFEMEGDLTCCGGDRGDAAMIAYGGSQFALYSGNKAIGEEMWPLIQWGLAFNKSKINSEGVVDSDTDEMEGRIPTGTANLSTSSLYYGALLHAADLGESLGKSGEEVARYRNEAKILGENIEAYFGATIEGLKTYKYFKEHDKLRHWICLPLVMGIYDRKEATLNALFGKLWTDNGVRVEYNPSLEEPDLFWDRGTLYAFRGAFKAGAGDRAYQKLKAYSTTRLLGFHVPYVVEAWPEGDMAHLSAESALYCRIFTEGLLGINPKSLNSFEISPQLPSDWDGTKLKNIHAFGRKFDLEIKSIEDSYEIIVKSPVSRDQKFQCKKGGKVLIKLD